MPPTGFLEYLERQRARANPPTTAPTASLNGKAVELVPSTPRPKRAARGSPTKRSLELLRREGYCAAVVEKWNPHARVRQDLFNCIDVVAVRADLAGVLGVQCTSTPNQAARLTKALVTPELRTWLAAQNEFQVWGWHKSRKSRRWQVTRRALTAADVRG
jgi:hypothetical protein